MAFVKTAESYSVNAHLNPTGRALVLDCPACGYSITFGASQFRARRTCGGCRSVMRIANRDVTSTTPAGTPRTATFAVRFIAISQGFREPESTEVSGEDIREELITEYRETLAKATSKIRDEAVAAARKAASEMLPVVRELIAPTVEPITVTGDRHQAYDEVMEVITALGKAFMVGPAGTGKSTLARQIAEDLELDFGYLPCTEGLNEAQILGRMNMAGDYIGTEFIRIFENGGIFLFDEIDAMDANVALVLNEAINTGIIAVPNRTGKPIAVRHDDCVILAAANTYGTGSDTTYVGRNQLDAAFLDRFAGGIVKIGYDRERERAIAESYKIIPLLHAIWRVRENVEKNRIARPVTTRWMIHLGLIHQKTNEKYDYASLLERTFYGWTDQERAKAVEGVDLDALASANVDTAAPVEKTDPVSTEPTSVPSGASPKCPECASEMKLRIAARGPRKGKSFWGCVTFPRCRATIDAPNRKEG
jgi:MoxR-like ATPase